MIDKIFDIPNSPSGKLLWTVVVLVVDEELLLDDDAFEEVFVLEVFDVLELLELLEVLEVFDVFELFDVLDDVLVSLISISTAKTFVVKDNTININIIIIEIKQKSREIKKQYFMIFNIVVCNIHI